MGAAIAAAFFAKKAADHTETGAKAADTAVSVARDTAKKQLRAYVGIDGAKLAPRKPTAIDETNTHASFVLKNFGQTPAEMLFVKMRIRVVHDEPGDFPYSEADSIGDGQMLNPGQVFPAGGDFYLSTDNHDRICNDVSKVVVFGQFAFKDEYGRKSVFDFRYGSSGRDFLNGELRVELLRKRRRGE